MIKLDLSFKNHSFTLTKLKRKSTLSQQIQEKSHKIQQSLGDINV